MCEFTGQKYRALTDDDRDEIVSMVERIEQLRLEYPCKPAGKKRGHIEYDRFINIKQANLDEKNRVISLKISVGENLHKMIAILT